MKGHSQRVSVSSVSSTNKPRAFASQLCFHSRQGSQPYLSLQQTDESLAERGVEFHCCGVYSWMPSAPPPPQNWTARGLVLMPSPTSWKHKQRLKLIKKRVGKADRVSRPSQGVNSSPTCQHLGVYSILCLVIFLSKKPHLSFLTARNSGDRHLRIWFSL